MLATGCRFFGNALEGLDVDLAAPLATTTTTGGTMRVVLRACRFERNGLDGLLVDQEHEFFPRWRTELQVLDCIARANRRAGVHLDADADGSWLIDGLRATANGTDGVLVTSESFAGDAWLSRSWLCGNLGAGARTALGNVALHGSHCAFAGNRLGGMVHERLASGAANCIAWQQPNAFAGTHTVGCVDASVSTAIFRAAPIAFAAATAQTNGVLTLDGTSPFAANSVVELADDGIRRLATQSAGTTVVLDAAPTLFVPPESVFGFAVDFVTEDLRLLATSPARGQGMAVPGASPVDPGPLGAAIAREPGITDPTAGVGLHSTALTPTTAAAIGAATAIALTFDRPLDAGTFTAARVRAIGPSGPLAAGIGVASATLTVTPPSTGWPATFHLELHTGLRALDGRALATPAVLPFHR
ncbi:MAG: hypothetical protein IPK26_10275 [Planctomycetes bacterium]|nr:hypothetical protein [Planctomycetota bacterium]